MTAVTNDYAAAPEAELGRIPSVTRLVGLDEHLIRPDDAHAYKTFDGHKVFQQGQEVPVSVDPPGTVAVVRGSRTHEAQDGKLVIDYLVQLKRPGHGAAQL